MQHSFPASFPPSLPASLVPFQGRAPWCWLLSSRPGEVCQGQEGQMGLLAERLLIRLFLIPLSVCRCFWWWWHCLTLTRLELPLCSGWCVYQQASCYIHQLPSTCSGLECATTSLLPFYTSHTSFLSRQLFDR